MDIALLYRARLAAQAEAAFSLQATQTGAARQALGITGFRLIADGYVYELLEGEFAAVSSAFGAVLVDDRLQSIEMLSNAAIDRRVCHQWAHGAVSEDVTLPAEIEAKVQMLHHFAQRFGATPPVLRDFLARIGQDISAPASRLPRKRVAQYALAS